MEKRRDTLLRNNEGEISATKIFVNLYLFIAASAAVAFLVRDLLAGVSLDQLHVVLISIFVSAAILNKEFSRRLLSKMSSFKVGTEGVEFSFGGEPDPDEQKKGNGKS